MLHRFFPTSSTLRTQARFDFNDGRSSSGTVSTVVSDVDADVELTLSVLLLRGGRPMRHGGIPVSIDE